jgi:hypothetical protein
MMVLAMKPTMPKDSTKNNMMVPVFPAFAFQAISPMMKSMKSMNAPTPKVMPKSEICSSVSPNIDGALPDQLLRLARLAAMRMRSALSLIKPAASFWSYAPASSSKVAIVESNSESVFESRPTTLTFPL